ncbi:hypothetical protein B0H15DRAFT_826207 [Mycena belliarum]|uniref:Uncharacterized protein n=1 Tax=Mycena belliarum TaxID=1033014 RepID=A0AAD6UFF2_9AGAR|nr:hypothetical protein B0H15DRAFT_826207 [Mycena belliae]
MNTPLQWGRRTTASQVPRSRYGHNQWWQESGRLGPLWASPDSRVSSLCEWDHPSDRYALGDTENSAPIVIVYAGMLFSGLCIHEGLGFQNLSLRKDLGDYHVACGWRSRSKNRFHPDANTCGSSFPYRRSTDCDFQLSSYEVLPALGLHANFGEIFFGNA